MEQRTIESIIELINLGRWKSVRDLLTEEEEIFTAKEIQAILKQIDTREHMDDFARCVVYAHLCRNDELKGLVDHYPKELESALQNVIKITIEEREIENAQSVPTVSELQNEIEELTQHNTELATENTRLRKKLSEVKKKNKLQNVTMLEDEIKSLKAKIVELQAEKDADNVWFKYMTRENVVKYIASKRDSAKFDDLMSLVQAILPKTMHEQFDDDVEAVREKRHKKHEKPTTVNHFHDNSKLQVVGDKGTAIDNVDEYYSN